MSNETLEIDEAVYRRLSTYSDLTALVSTRIYPKIAPETATLPRITFNMVSNAPYHASGYDAVIHSPRIQISCWDTSYRSINLIAIQVKAALQDYSGTITTPVLDANKDLWGNDDTWGNSDLWGRASISLVVQRSFFEHEVDLEDVEANTNKIIYHRALDFIIWHE